MNQTNQRPVEITPKEAEKFLGLRVDRRKKYFFWDQQPDEYDSWTTKYKIFELAKWVERCHGCTEFGEYGQYADDHPLDPKLNIRIGNQLTIVSLFKI